MSFGDVIMFQSGFIMGETLVEEFRIHVDNYSDNLIFPSCKGADQDALVLGPGNGPKGYHWRVDAREYGAQKGDLFVVTFVWYPKTHEKRVTWELMEEDLELPFVLSTYVHSYSIRGSWTAWAWREMQQVAEGSYESVVRIRLTVKDGHIRLIIRSDGPEQLWENSPAPAALTDS